VNASSLIMAASLLAPLQHCEEFGPTTWSADPSSDLKNCVALATSGDAHAQYAIASAAFYASCEPGDERVSSKGDAWLYLAARNGEARALEWEATQIIYGVPIGDTDALRRAVVTALPKLELAVAKGIASAASQLYEYLSRTYTPGIPSSHSAAHYLRRAIELGEPRALRILASEELYALSVTTDDRRHSSSKADDASLLREEGLLAAPTRMSAFHHAIQAARAGDDMAISLVADRLASGPFTGLAGNAETLGWIAIDAFRPGRREATARALAMLASSTDALRADGCAWIREATTSSKYLPGVGARPERSEWNDVDEYVRQSAYPAAISIKCIETATFDEIPLPRDAHGPRSPVKAGVPQFHQDAHQ